jgi:hypothetical protein
LPAWVARRENALDLERFDDLLAAALAPPRRRP